ncbi:MAG: cell surface protein SprA, partial [Flavobacteriia bacterium]
IFEGQSRMETGTLTYSTISFNSAFVKSNSRNGFSSDVFNTLLDNRKAVSENLGLRNGNSNKLSSGYYSGYDGTQQEVVIGSFLTAFTGNEVNEKNVNPLKNIPLPNWTVNYNGLTKFEKTKKYVKNFVIKHGYTSSVSVAGLQTNLNAQNDANGNPAALDLNNNYIVNRQIQTVTISERFSPLIGIDATWNVKGQGLITKFEFKKDRNASLSLANNQVTEIMGKEIVIGTGYKFSKVKFKKIKALSKYPASDINFRFDFSFRDNLTVVRKIAENTNQATAGQTIVSIKSSLDYNIGQNVTVVLYYDQVINTPKIASSYPTANTSAGLRIRLNLAGL